MSTSTTSATATITNLPIPEFFPREVAGTAAETTTPTNRCHDRVGSWRGCGSLQAESRGFNAGGGRDGSGRRAAPHGRAGRVDGRRQDQYRPAARGASPPPLHRRRRRDRGGGGRDHRGHLSPPRRG